MYKKTAVQSSHRLTPAQAKSQTGKEAKQLSSEVCTLWEYTPFFLVLGGSSWAYIISMYFFFFFYWNGQLPISLLRCFGGGFQRAVQLVETKAEQLSLKPRSKFTSLGSIDGQSETLQLPRWLLSIHKCKCGYTLLHMLLQVVRDICVLCSSPDVLAKKYGICKQLKVSLTRTPVPGSAPTASSFSSQVQNQVAHIQTPTLLLSVRCARDCSTISCNGLLFLRQVMILNALLIWVMCILSLLLAAHSKVCTPT